MLLFVMGRREASDVSVGESVSEIPADSENDRHTLAGRSADP
ncbi:MAG: hypothetical protein ACI8TP_004774 [Acidimicrobiales bacterium]